MAIWKSDNYRKRNEGKKQKKFPKIKQSRLWAITLQGSIEKNPNIQYLKNK